MFDTRRIGVGKHYSRNVLVIFCLPATKDDGKKRILVLVGVHERVCGSSSGFGEKIDEKGCLVPTEDEAFAN